jgi:amidohydrolase
MNPLYSPYEQELIQLRRYLHQHPEVGFELASTHEYVKNKLQSYHIHHIERAGQYSMIATLFNGDGPVIGLRADMDALPMQEQNTHEYCSIHGGKMHACGHDAHTSMLLTAGKFLMEHLHLWRGTVKLIFQEAEEGPDPGGAYGIVQSGLVDDVECFFGLHVSPMHPSGVIAIKSGEAMASADTISIKLFGKGTHAAYPHQGIDLALLQADIVKSFQQIVSRLISPVDHAVVTIAKIQLGTAHNIIAESAILEGTVRTFSNSMRDFIEAKMNQILQGLCMAYGATYEFDYIRTYDPTINTPQVVNYLKMMVEEQLGIDRFQEILKPSMGAEDFSRYIFHRQGAIAWLGTSKDDETSFALHHPKFNIDESAMLTGVQALTQFVIHYQEASK